MKSTLKKKTKSGLSRFRPQLRSRHPSHHSLRSELPLLPFRSVIRLGSITELGDEVSNGGKRIECNTAEAVSNSMDKLSMKRCFDKASVKTAAWLEGNSTLLADHINAHGFPIVAKHRFGSRGRGNYLLSSQQELAEWLRAHPRLENYIFEKFYNYSREYRLHVTANGCFYTCRKMLRDKTPEDSRWFRNDSNSVWIVEENEAFDKPSNWGDIVSECVKALKAVGLDVGACDVKVQSSTTSKGTKRKNPEFIVIEINSAPSFGERTLQHYLQQIPEILKSKYGSK